MERWLPAPLAMECLPVYKYQSTHIGYALAKDGILRQRVCRSHAQHLAYIQYLAPLASCATNPHKVSETFSSKQLYAYVFLMSIANQHTSDVAPVLWHGLNKVNSAHRQADQATEPDTE